MTEEQADGVSKRWVEVDASVVQLRLNTFQFFAGRFRAKGYGDVLSTWTGVFNDDRPAAASSIPLIQPELP